MNDFAAWRGNRAQSFSQKFTRWRGNPAGAAVRSLEFLYFGSPLNNLIQGDVSEVLPLNGDSIRESGGLTILSNVPCTARSGLVRLASGHVLSQYLDGRYFLSGQQWSETHAVLKGKPQAVIEQGVVLPHAGYYYHFMDEIAPRLLALAQLQPDAVVIVKEDQPAFVSEVVEALGLRAESTRAELFTVRELTLLPARGVSLVQLADRMRQWGQSGQPSPKRIFIPRGAGARSDNALDDSLAALAAAHGFVMLLPGELTLRKQIDSFAGATAVLGMHGGALTNLMFCQPGTQVFEVFTHVYRTYVFERLSRQLGLAYTAAEAEEALSTVEHWFDQLRET